jgi:hypothetical protein
MLLKGGYRICDICREIPKERKTLVKLGKVDASQSLERHPHQSLLVARIPEMNQERYYELSLNGELYVQGIWWVSECFIECLPRVNSSPPNYLLSSKS